MNGPTALWRSTTHDWAKAVDVDHLDRIRQDPAGFSPGGVSHLILEILAYAADEAEHNGGGHCTVTLHSDGSVTVSDDGRGTATGFTDDGSAVRKPVMATKDLRFFDSPDAETLPDGRPRRGASVVAALSQWLIHTNRRAEGAWTQRYEHGVPVTGLEPVPADGSTGTTVRFLPDQDLGGLPDRAADDLLEYAASWPHLAVSIDV